jgi:hypothetical protein
MMQTVKLPLFVKSCVLFQNGVHGIATAPENSAVPNQIPAFDPFSPLSRGSFGCREMGYSARCKNQGDAQGHYGITHMNRLKKQRFSRMSGHSRRGPSCIVWQFAPA